MDSDHKVRGCSRTFGSFLDRFRSRRTLTMGLVTILVGTFLTGCDLIEPYINSEVDLDLSKPPVLHALEGEVEIFSTDGIWNPLTDSVTVTDSADVRIASGSAVALNWDGRTFQTIRRAEAPTAKATISRGGGAVQQIRRDSVSDCPIQVAGVDGVVEVKLPGSDEWIVPKAGETLPRDTQIAVGFDSVLHLNNPCTEHEDDKFLVIEGLTEGTPELRDAIERKKYDEIYDSEIRVHIKVEDVSASFRVATPRIITAIKG